MSVPIATGREGWANWNCRRALPEKSSVMLEGCHWTDGAQRVSVTRTPQSLEWARDGNVERSDSDIATNGCRSRVRHNNGILGIDACLLWPARYLWVVSHKQALTIGFAVAMNLQLRVEILSSWHFSEELLSIRIAVSSTRSRWEGQRPPSNIIFVQYNAANDSIEWLNEKDYR